MSQETTTEMSTDTKTDKTVDTVPVLQATDLVVEYTTKHGRVRSLDAATLTVRPGQIVALVGESGSGKSTLGMATGRLLASNAVHISGGLSVDGRTVYDADDPARSPDDAGLRGLRRDVLGFVFQNPVAALDPTMRVQRQLERATGASKATIVDALNDVGLKDVPRVLRSFPHELSGGMAQRVGIAMALQRGPRLLVADEPTAAVDATLRAQILNLLVTRCRDQGCALLLMTHDLHAVAEHSERIAVMYGGRVVEHGATKTVLADPLHPYTNALVSALPGEEKPGQRLEAIRGVPPVLRGESPGCAFAPRCPDRLAHCAEVRPVYDLAASGRNVACHLHTGQPTDEAPTGVNGAKHDRPDAQQLHLDREEATR